MTLGKYLWFAYVCLLFAYKENRRQFPGMRLAQEALLHRAKTIGYA